MPLVSVVLPLPRSPERRIMSGAFAREANSLPHAMVSSAECVTISSGTEADLLKKSVTSRGNGRSDAARQLPRSVGPSRCVLRGFTVQIRAKRENTEPIACTELPRERGQDAREDVAGTAFGKG